MNTTRSAQAFEALSKEASKDTVGFFSRIVSVPSMLLSALRGVNPEVSRGKALMFVLAALYIVSPVDLVPEVFVPVVGLVDDAMVASWLVVSVLAAAGSYVAFKDGMGTANTVVGEIVREDELG